MMFNSSQNTVRRPDWKVICLASALIVVALGASVCLPAGFAQQAPKPVVEKTPTEIQLESELADCRAELSALKESSVPDVDDNQYIQNIESLQQRIEQTK